MCRVTICCEGPRDILTVLNWFLDNNSAQFSVPVIKIKNKFGESSPDRVSECGSDSPMM